MLDLIGRNSPHIHSSAGRIPIFNILVVTSREIRHIGFSIDRYTVHQERSAQRRDIIIGTASIRLDSRSRLPQADQVGSTHIGNRRTFARQQRYQIGKARRLQVLHGLTVDLGRAGHPPGLGSRHHHLIQIYGIGFKESQPRKTIVHRDNLRIRFVP